MSTEEIGRQQEREPCAPWCALRPDEHDTCARELIRGNGPADLSVLLTWRRDGTWPNVVVMSAPPASEAIAIINVVQAQGIATALAYLAPSTRTAEFARAFQRAATYVFPAFGLPETGPMKGAHNPWKAGPRLGDRTEGPPSGL